MAEPKSAVAERQLRLEIARQHRVLAELEEQLAVTLAPEAERPTADKVATRVRRAVGGKR
jgi:hypothetical protein